MLVIRRRQGESLVLDTPAGRVEIDIVELSAARVKVGITAPAEIRILRKEVVLAQQENLAAAGGVSSSGIQALLDGLQTGTAGSVNPSPILPGER